MISAANHLQQSNGNKQNTMKKLLSVFLFLSLINTASAETFSGPDTVKHFRVGVFAPLFLDSAFNGNNYRYNKNFPRFSFAGMEFIQGVQIALDSLDFSQHKITVSFFDTQAPDFESKLESAETNNLDILIGSVREYDHALLAGLAKRKNIPFVSVTYPNDGGITANPFLIIMNSTLKAHCETLFNYLLQKFGTHNIVFCTKSGVQEDRVMDYFKGFNKPDGSALMDMKIANVDENYDKLIALLDSNKSNIILGASLDETFAKQLAKNSMQWNKKYDIQLIGMPNWEGIFNVRNANNNKDFPVFFTSAFYNEKDEELNALLENTYQQKFFVSPSDHAQKGFESIAVFLNMLIQHPADFMSYINNAEYKIFSTYKFRPVMLSKESVVPDYFENKHLNFLKSLNGKITKAW